MTLSAREKLDLSTRLLEEKTLKIWRRLKCLDLKEKGFSHNQIAEILDIRRETISLWLKQYREEGLDGLCFFKYEGRRTSKLAFYKQEIQEHIQKENVSTVAELQHWLEGTFDLSVEQSWLSRWLKKNSIVLIKKQD